MPTIDDLKTFGQRAADRFLLRDAERIVTSRPAQTSELLARLVETAGRRATAAEQLMAEEDSASALTLYRDAGALLAAAISIQAAGQTSLPDSLDPASRWADLADGKLPAGAPPALLRVRHLLATNDVGLADSLSPDEQRARRTDASEALTWMRAQLEPRTTSMILRARQLRVLALVTLSVLAMLAFVAFLRRPKNLALHKPTTMSSQRPGSPSAEGATNGTIEAGYGVHTGGDDVAWIAIDLLREERIAEVRVVGRGDGYESDCVPLLVETSMDGQHYAEIARRTLPFKQNDPWVVRPTLQFARFVRVRTPQKGYIALSEIEVYAK